MVERDSWGILHEGCGGTRRCELLHSVAVVRCKIHLVSVQVVHLSKLVRSSGTVYSTFEDNRQLSSVNASNRFDNIATALLRVALCQFFDETQMRINTAT